MTAILICTACIFITYHNSSHDRHLVLYSLYLLNLSLQQAWPPSCSVLFVFFELIITAAMAAILFCTVCIFWTYHYSSHGRYLVLYRLYLLNFQYHYSSHDGHLVLYSFSLYLLNLSLPGILFRTVQFVSYSMNLLLQQHYHHLDLYSLYLLNLSLHQTLLPSCSVQFQFVPFELIALGILFRTVCISQYELITTAAMDAILFCTVCIFSTYHYRSQGRNL